jgi:transcriptional regulator with XRE-family HTH domain
MHTFQAWLNQQFLEWERHCGTRKTVTDWAAHLGFGKGVVSNWLNGKRVPDQSSAARLAQTLGNGVYSALGLPKPDRSIQALIALANELDANDIDNLVHLAGNILEKKQAAHDSLAEAGRKLKPKLR